MGKIIMTFVVKASIFLVLPFLVFGEDDSIQGKTVVVTAVESRPYLMSTPDGYYRGYLVDLLKELSKFLKFKYEIKLVDDGKYGGFDGSKWNGMMGEVISGTADIALADITMTAMREKHVDFSHPFMQLGITAIYSKSTDKLHKSTLLKISLTVKISNLVFLATDHQGNSLKIPTLRSTREFISAWNQIQLSTQILTQKGLSESERRPDPMLTSLSHQWQST